MIDKLRFYIRHSINDILVNRQRSAFALLCIAAGVAAIVSLQTLGIMIDDTLTGSLQETNKADIRLRAFADFGVEFDDSRRERDGIVVEIDGDNRVFSADGLRIIEEFFTENASGEVRFTYQQPTTGAAGINLTLPERDTSKFFVLPYIVEGDQYPLYGSIESIDGVPLSEMLSEPTHIVFSRNLADDLGAKVGDIVRINEVSEDFTLAGIVPTDSEGGFENILAGILGYYYIDVEALAFFNDAQPSANTIFVGLEDASQVDELNEAFEARYPYIGTTTTSELEEQNSLISNVVNDMVIIMGLVSMLIGGIGIVNTMAVIVTRRTTEVAVLKTLGLEAEDVTILFLVEAIIMGIVGSLAGIVLGWVMAIVLQGVAEQFVAQSLSFRIAPTPAITGFVVGVIITTIFGIIPTLSAGLVRPASILRPSDSVLPKGGGWRSFAALMFVLFAISLVAQGIIGDLLDFDSSVFNIITTVNGVIIGFLMAAPIVIGGIISLAKDRKGRSWATHSLLWFVILGSFMALGGLFGFFVNTIILISVTFILVGLLYILLNLLIWAVGGGNLKEFPILGNFPPIIRIPLFLFFPVWAAFTIFLVVILGPTTTPAALFMGLLFWVHIPAIIVTLVLPGWALGQFLQRFGFLDLKVALRAMVSTRTRGAATLLALVIGIFTLSLITMIVDTFTQRIEELLEDETGGNVLIFPAGDPSTVEEVRTVLSEADGVRSFAISQNYEATFNKLIDVSEEESLDLAGLEQRIRDDFDENSFLEPDDVVDSLTDTLVDIDGRELGSNLPDVRFADGGQLDPATDTEPDEDGYYPIIITGTEGVLQAGIEVGDLITFTLSNDPVTNQTFRIVGIVDASGGSVEGFGASNYTAIEAFGDREPDERFAVADVNEDDIPALRRELNEIPAVFVIETRFINDLINSIINQFTSFPLLVAGLSLFVGGVVIANSVALSTLERRREIGIMKAVGLQRERVLGMLLLENGIMGFIGGLIGVGIGVLLLVFSLSVVFQGELGNSIPYLTAFGLMAVCIVIALVAAIISVWGASGEKPLNVLRYE